VQGWGIAWNESEDRAGEAAGGATEEGGGAEGQGIGEVHPGGDEEVHAEWNVPASWKLRAQLVFGSVEGEAKEKGFVDDAVRFKVFK
jgi:predicted oxidoreductase (fatty acid repression mutant protein)